MPVYKRCINCKRDHKQNTKKCTCELTLVDPTCYRQKIKFKRNGKWKSKILPKGTTLREARKIEQEMLQELTPKVDPLAPNLITKDSDFAPIAPPEGSHLPSTDISFDTYYSASKLMKKSYIEDLRTWNKHVKGRDFETVQGIMTILGGMKEKGYAPATIQHVLQIIRRVHNWHIENDIHPTGKNPCRTIKLPKFDNRLTDGLPEDEMRKLITYLRNPENEKNNRRTALVTLVAIATGRRQGEILDLLKEDVDLTRGTMTCRNTKSGKTLSFPLNEIAVEAIEEAITYTEEEEPRVFTYTRHGFKSNWIRFRVRLVEQGVLSKTIRFHALRHTVGSHLANQGVSIYTIQKLLGHSTIELTQRYSHLNDVVLKDAIGNMV